MKLLKSKLSTTTVKLNYTGQICSGSSNRTTDYLRRFLGFKKI
jgi:hypothetical protein